MGPFHDSFPPAGGSGERIQTKEVVVMAAMVPTGMDFWASRRSPERLEPAMIPGEIIRTGKLINNRRGSKEMKAVATSLRKAAVTRGERRRRRGDAHPSQRGSRCRPAA